MLQRSALVLQPLPRWLLRQRCWRWSQRLNRDVAPLGAGVAAELDAALYQRVDGVVAALQVRHAVPNASHTRMHSLMHTIALGVPGCKLSPGARTSPGY